MDVEAAEAPAPLPSRLKVALTILFHSSSAILSTLVSKAALNHLDSPILLLTLQFAVQVLLLTSIGVPMQYIKIQKPLSVWKSLLPLTLARVTGILAKTFCLAAVDAAFYQVARGLLLPFTLLLSLALLRPMPHFPTLSLLGIALVMMGFAAGLSNDFSMNLTGAKGIILGVGSSFTTAVESVVVKRYLKPAKTTTVVIDAKGGEVEEEELGVWQMVWMSNVLSLFFFVPLLVASGNLSTLTSLLLQTTTTTTTTTTPLPTGTDPTAPASLAFLPLAFLTGLVGFLLTIATFMQINVTSPTTHMIVTATRGVAQSGLAVLLLRETVTVGRVSSMGFILGGSVVYGWAKDRVAYGEGKGGVRLGGGEGDGSGSGGGNGQAVVMMEDLGGKTGPVHLG